jgi:DNA-binding LacI/PurR family transcriptional regulator
LGAKHSEISRQLLEDITAGTYPPGSRLPSESELVQRFEVSRPTIAQAMRDLQGRGLISRRPGSGTYVLRAENKPTTLRQLGLLVPGVQLTGIFEIISSELANLARSKNYGLVLGGVHFTHTDAELNHTHAMELCEQFIAQGVSGVFFTPFELTGGNVGDSEKITKRFQQAKIPVVLLDRDLASYPRRSEFDLVTVDNVEGGFLLASHLLDMGCRRLAFTCRPNSAPTVQARMAGVREALAAHNLIETKGWVKIGEPNDEAFARSFVAEKWDGVVCANDATAAHLLRSLNTIGAHVPKDIKIVGFDDAKFAAFLNVALTTAQQPCQGIASSAFHALLDRIAHPRLPARCITISPTLVVRESCGERLSKPASAPFREGEQAASLQSPIAAS